MTVRTLHLARQVRRAMLPLAIVLGFLLLVFAAVKEARLKRAERLSASEKEAA